MFVLNKKNFFLFLAVAFLILPLGALASEDDEKEKASIPRFVSTRSDEINVRTGPGARYPIKWVIVRKNMPVEVLAEYEDWRKIRDISQDEGWVHKAMLSRKRSGIIKSDNKKIFEKPDTKSRIKAIANKGAILNVEQCDGTYCLVENKDVEGYINSDDIWGIYENEKFKR